VNTNIPFSVCDIGPDRVETRARKMVNLEFKDRTHLFILIFGGFCKENAIDISVHLQATGMFDAIDTSKDRHQLEHSYRFYFMTNSDAEDGSNMDKTVDDLYSTGISTVNMLMLSQICDLGFIVAGSFGTVEQFWYVHGTESLRPFIPSFAP
jgi:hypothetical protein